MHLASIELQGFKTFAKKTKMDFPKSKDGSKTITVVVGPNGSGKSNLTDAIRWCLGEQSMKSLRGKESSDIIFSGSDGKGRSGFAKVSMTFTELNGLDVPYSELVISRTLHRDGASKYQINGKTAKLSDIHYLLAEAGVGGRSYSVIGQGMIDHILAASPEERKVFFDDATGVRTLQIKRKKAERKFERVERELGEVERLLEEIEPRLKLLERQMRKLEQRKPLEEELASLQGQYFALEFSRIDSELEKQKAVHQELKPRKAEKQNELKELDNRLKELEKSMKDDAKPSKEETDARAKVREIEKSINQARDAEYEATKQIEIEKAKQEHSWSPLPLPEIQDRLKGLASTQADVQKAIESGEAHEGLLRRAKELRKNLEALLSALTKPKKEEITVPKELLSAQNGAREKQRTLKEELRRAEKAALEARAANKQDSTEVFAVERKARSLRAELSELEQKSHAADIELARWNTKRESLTSELREEAPHLTGKLPEVTDAAASADHIRSRVLAVKSKLEAIGRIDEETEKEHKETKERFDFLSHQSEDLHSTLSKTKTISRELKKQIEEQLSREFKRINKEFKRFFKMLFSGGTCNLKQVEEKRSPDETHMELDRAMHESDVEKTTSGVEIQATPPGKKLKALNLLSGGERALTSIALISAIMSTNPSPFVVLDEVDAALDESNTKKFAGILGELRGSTQFIVVTHNRATMESADLLYGVTMGDDGISRILSVDLTDMSDDTSRR
jgi:chromosome segregation protein